MSIAFDFRGRTALVTGAAQGIGHAIATMFHDAGARVAAVDRDAAALAAAWDGKERVSAYAVDVTDSAAVTAAVDAVVADTGSIDIVVNNAGITRDTVVWKMSDEQWQAVIDVHLKGTFAMTRAAVPHMRAAGFGRVVNVTS